MNLDSRWKVREIDLLAGAAIAAMVVLGLAVQRTLSPDGVSYLDLADAVRRGDLNLFIQGYWSPFYPAVLAVAGMATGRAGNQLVATAHAVNVIAVVVTIGVIWRWSRRANAPWFGRAAIAALLVSSGEPPRVDAVTPDLVLLCIVTCIGYELAVHRGRRWGWLGVLLGLTYLTRTAAWPWILITVAAQVALAPDRAARALVGRSGLVAAVVALLWIAPLSYVMARPTLGSAGRLSYHWYLEGSDARTPDTHLGEHAQYEEIPIADSVTIRVARFDTTSQATYQPWSDPEGWSFGLRTHRATPATFGGVTSYWLDTIWLALSVWLRTLIVAVLLPALWIGRRRGMWRELLRPPREAPLILGLGLAALALQIAVHAEPGMIAPFVTLFTLGALHWLFGAADRAAAPPRTLDRIALSLLGLAAAAYFTGRRIERARTDDRRIAAGVDRLVAVNAAAFATHSDSAAGFAGAVSSSAPAHPRVAVLGPVMPVLANIFWTGGRVVAQVPPQSVPALRNMPVDRRSTLLHQLFNDRADVIWITGSDGNYDIVRVP